MENNEVLNENEEKAMALAEMKGGNIQSFESLGNNSNTECNIYTNINDKKKLFNLESNVDCLLNDCENELIRVKGVLLKIYKKPLKEPVINQETGEIEKEFETSMSCVLLDDNGKSYATGSKMFAIQLMRYIQNWGMADFEEGLEIKIIKRKLDSGNKALAFELV